MRSQKSKCHMTTEQVDFRTWHAFLCLKQSFFAAGAGSLLTAIVNSSLTRSISVREEADIGFSRKKIPESSERIVDALLGTLLNG